MLQQNICWNQWKWLWSQTSTRGPLRVSERPDGGHVPPLPRPPPPSRSATPLSYWWSLCTSCHLTVLIVLVSADDVDASEKTLTQMWHQQKNKIKALEDKYRWKLNENGVSVRSCSTSGIYSIYRPSYRHHSVAGYRRSIWIRRRTEIHGLQHDMETQIVVFFSTTNKVWLLRQQFAFRWACGLIWMSLQTASVLS